MARCDTYLVAIWFGCSFWVTKIVYMLILWLSAEKRAECLILVYHIIRITAVFFFFKKHKILLDQLCHARQRSISCITLRKHKTATNFGALGQSANS